MSKVILSNVPFHNQRDDYDGETLCFTKTCSMIAEYNGVADEARYNEVRNSYGSSVIAYSQIQAMKYLGLNPKYSQEADWDTIRKVIDSGQPIGLGWLHHGPFYRPTSSGHWSLCYGYDDTGLYIRDPYGDPDLINGGWIFRNYITMYGRSLKFSYKNFGPRWLVEGPNKGYVIYNLA